MNIRRDISKTINYLCIIRGFADCFAVTPTIKGILQVFLYCKKHKYNTLFYKKNTKCYSFLSINKIYLCAGMKHKR